MAACWSMLRFAAHAAAIGQTCFRLPSIPFHQEPRQGMFGQIGPAPRPAPLAAGADLRIAASVPRRVHERRTRRERGDSARIQACCPGHRRGRRSGLCKDSGGPERGAPAGPAPLRDRQVREGRAEAALDLPAQAARPNRVPVAFQDGRGAESRQAGASGGRCRVAASGHGAPLLPGPSRAAAPCRRPAPGIFQTRRRAGA